MSDFNSTCTRPRAPSEPPAAGRETASAVPPQARRDFDAALRRADRREPEREETHDPDEHAPPCGLAAMGLPLSHGAGASGAASEARGSAPSASLPGAHGGALVDAVPVAPGLLGLTATAREWGMQVRVDGQSNAALNMRLVNSGFGHWQMRLSTDSQTRQQLTPHVERLRDQLRQRSQGRFDGFSFEDEV